ncbi:hypothetical protein [Rhodopirellula halodulae]|nr:hypothetical protein [Rhodopirellula sp. JC737]
MKPALSSVVTSKIAREERVAYNKWTAIREFTRELVVDAIADSRR